jgi:hypothetical protein
VDDELKYRSLKLSNTKMKSLLLNLGTILCSKLRSLKIKNIIVLNNVDKERVSVQQAVVVKAFRHIFRDFILHKLYQNSTNEYHKYANREDRGQAYLFEYYSKMFLQEKDPNLHEQGEFVYQQNLSTGNSVTYKPNSSSSDKFEGENIFFDSIVWTKNSKEKHEPKIQKKKNCLSKMNNSTKLACNETTDMTW